MLVIKKLKDLKEGIGYNYYKYVIKVVDINSPLVKYVSLDDAIKVFENSRAKILKINVVFKEDSLIIAEIVSLLPNSVLARILQD